MLKKIKPIFLIVLIGLLLRLIFVLFVAKHYFGRENIFIDSDTGAWSAAIENLIKTGTYTVNPAHEYGFFGRMPGYSFFIGFFYLLSGMNWNIAYLVIAFVQIFMDAVAIFIVYKIFLLVYNNNKTAIIAAFIYATYPFIIVWTPVVYSESTSIFFMLAGIYYFINKSKNRNIILSAVLLSFAVLLRPQILFLVLFIGIILFFTQKKSITLALKKVVIFGFTVFLVYGSWPIRNYVFHGKFILTQDLRSFENWDTDVLSFWEYIYSIKAEWEPQFSQIIHNEKVEFPDIAYTSVQDSLMLDSAVKLSQTCGSGFSNWKGYWNKRIIGDNCNATISELFTKLRDNQIKNNPWNFYLYVPLQNLKKAILKISLTDSSTMVKKMASLLFIYRTLLILLGLFASVYLIIWSKESRYFILLALLYFMAVYIALCFGTGPQFRNIEMRYFLPADVLLIFPVAVFVSKIHSKFRNKAKI